MMTSSTALMICWWSGSCWPRPGVHDAQTGTVAENRSDRLVAAVRLVAFLTVARYRACH
jgi:hypothetical protein